MKQNNELRGAMTKASRDLIISCIVTFGAMLFVILVFGCQYQTNDDYAMSLTVSGAYGDTSPNLVFSSIIFGSLLQWLYTIAPLINWYAWLHITLIFVACSCCVFVILNHIHNRSKFIMAAVFTIIATVPITMQIQFTLQSYLCLTAGCLLAFHALNNKTDDSVRKQQIIMLCISSILILLGVMLRYNTYLSIIPFVIVYVLYACKKKYFKPLLWFLITVVICVGANYINDNANSDESWKEFYQFNQQRSALLDKPPIDYQENIDVFKSVNWSKTDYDVFYEWMIADENVYTTEKLTYISENSQASGISIFNATREFFESIRFDGYIGVLICMTMMLAICLLTRKKKLVPIAVYVMVLCIHAGFILLQRAPMRTVFPHYIMGILALIMMIDYSKFRFFNNKDRLWKNEKAIRSIGITSAMILALFGIFNFNMGVIGAAQARPIEKYRNVVRLDEYIVENKDKVFLSTVVAGGSRYKAYDVFDAPDKGMYENFSLLGGWYTKSPRYFQFLREYEIENMFLSLTREDVYLVAEDPSLVQIFLKDEYHIYTQAYMMEEFGDIGVYRLQEETQ